MTNCQKGVGQILQILCDDLGIASESGLTAAAQIFVELNRTPSKQLTLKERDVHIAVEREEEDGFFVNLVNGKKVTLAHCDAKGKITSTDLHADELFNTAAEKVRDAFALARLTTSERILAQMSEVALHEAQSSIYLKPFIENRWPNGLASDEPTLSILSLIASWKGEHLEFVAKRPNDDSIKVIFGSPDRQSGHIKIKTSTGEERLFRVGQPYEIPAHENPAWDLLRDADIVNPALPQRAQRNKPVRTFVAECYSYRF